MSKQTHSIGIVLVTVIAGGLLVLATAAVIPDKLPFASNDTLIPTQPISEERSTGGTVKHTSDGTQQDNTGETPGVNGQPTSKQDDTTPGQANPSERQPFDRAPKQTEIKLSVSNEQEYRALLLPNDPYAQSSWVFNSMKAPEAWDTATGGEVIVAVIDSGFALAHEDLANTWHLNSGEQGTTTSGEPCWTGTPTPKQSNDCDDDENGYVDDWRGWNFWMIDNDPQAGRDNPNGDAVSHGTQVAGLVGAESNNGIGTASFNWQTKIMPLQALSDDGSGYTSDIAAAIYYAVDNGAKIINMSLGASMFDPYVAAATDYAYNRDVIVVAAAGNCGTGSEWGCDPDRPGAMGYPALNDHVISVGALNSSNQRASFSSYGPALDIMAPGSGAIVSPMWLETNPISAYSGTLHGTSFAAPLVSSVAALLRSERPSTTADDIIALLNATANKLPALGSNIFLDQYGHGGTDAAASIAIAQSLASTANEPTLAQTGSVFSEHSFTGSSTLSSGCSTATVTHCSVWARSNEGHERYLPYKLTDGSSGWQWGGDDLGTGEWRLRARSGDFYSATSYYLFRK